jgi:hypothetical protein
MLAGAGRSWHGAGRGWNEVLLTSIFWHAKCNSFNLIVIVAIHSVFGHDGNSADNIGLYQNQLQLISNLVHKLIHLSFSQGRTVL